MAIDEEKQEMKEGLNRVSQVGQDNLQQESLNQSQSPTKAGGFLNAIRHPIQFLKDRMGLNFPKRKHRKSFIKRIWERIPIKVKIGIIIGISIVALIIVILLSIGDDTSKKAVSTRSNGVSKLNITDQSSSASQLALELYNKYDSLVGFTTAELQTIYDEFLSDTSNQNKYLLSSGQKKFGSITGEKYTLDQELSLYQHIQRTEKYNFNKIVWKEYTHTTDDVTMQTELREDVELYVPQGIDAETYETILKTASPYLFTQDIPLGLLAGMVAQSGGLSSKEADTAEKFVYQVIKESLSKIKINKYVLQSITLQSYYDDCNYNTYTQSYVVNIYPNGHEELQSEGTPVLQESRNEVTEEVKIDGSEVYNSETYWYVSEAIVYDRIINNVFDHKKYSDSDVQALKSPDNNTLIETVPINELSEVITTKNINSSGDIPTDDDGNPLPSTQVTREYKYIQREGTRYIYEKEWKDKLSCQKSENNEYTYDTALEYNTTTNSDYSHIATDKSTISTEEFNNKYPSGNSVFDKYVEEDISNKLYGMSIVDLMNTNKGVYSKYIKVSSLSNRTEAISRNEIKAGYNQVKNILNNLVNKSESGNSQMNFNSYTTGKANGTLPFVYGSSLGFSIASSSATGSGGTAYVGGINLLKEYLRALEGIGYSADPQSTKVVTEGEKDYYIVATNMTVGYGVDLSQNIAWKQEIESIIGTTIVPGTKIEVEIVDQYEENYMMDKYNKIKNDYPDLTEYQVHALVVRAYNTGNANGYADHQSEYNESTDNLYETVYEEFKDNQTAVTEIKNRANKNSILYINYMSTPKTAVGMTGDVLEGRRFSEWCLFSLGYYDRLQRFYTAGGGSPGGISLLNADGTVNASAVDELCLWYEDNIFSGYFHGNDYVIDNLPSGTWYSAKTLEAAKYVQGEIFQMTGIDYSGGQYKAVSANNLGIFQCTWWADCRARLYLQDAGYTGNFSTRGDGGSVAGNFSTDYGVALNTNINAIKPHSIASFGSSGTGHVVFVEEVGTDYYVVSHCGSGHVWHGVDMIPIGSTVFGKSFQGSVCLDDLL